MSRAPLEDVLEETAYVFNERGRLIGFVHSDPPAPSSEQVHFFNERGRLIASVYP